MSTSQRETQGLLASRQPTTAARPLPPDQRRGRGHFARAIGADVPKVTAAAFERYGFHSAEIMTSWATIVGADLARLTRPQAIKWPHGNKARTNAADDETGSPGATLVAACDPAFALEISYRTADVIDRINRYFGYRAIAHLRIVQVPQSASPASAAPGGHEAHAAARTTEGRGLAEALDQLGKSVAANGSRRGAGEVS